MIKMWNEVVQAYDEAFHELEAARDEYGKAIERVMAALHNGIQQSHGNEVVYSKDEGFARHWLYCSVAGTEGVEWLCVHAWIAAPYAGPAGTLRIAVEHKLGEVRERYGLAWEQPALVAMAAEPAAWKTSIAPDLLHGPLATMGWLRVKEISLLQDDPVTPAVSRFVTLVAEAREFAARLDAEARPIVRAFAALKALAKELESHPLSPNQKARDYLCKPWEGLRYVRADEEGLPEFWVGYQPEQRRLLYGHEESDNRRNLAAEFAKKARSSEAFQLGGYPAGVLMDSDRFEEVTVEEIKVTALGAFKAFRELLTTGQ